MHPATDQYDNLSNRLQAAFIRIAKDEHLWQSDLYGALRDATTMLASTLELTRASVWLFNEEQASLECRLLFRADRGSFESGAKLHAKSCPQFFRTLDESRVLDISDAANDIRIADLYPNYLRPQGTGAALLATLSEAGRFTGMLCLEHVGSPRLWSRDEQLFATSVADLLSQLQMFHALKDSERSYRTLFDAAADAIFTLRDGFFIDCNARAEALTGYTREQLIGHHPAEFSPPTQGQGQTSREYSEEFHQAAIEKGPQLFTWFYKRADGSLIETEVSLSSMWLGGLCHMLAIVRDATERRNQEQLQIQIAQQLERHNKMLQVVNSLASNLHRTTDSVTIAQETLRVLQVLQPSPLATFHHVVPSSDDFELIASTGYSEEQVAARRILPINNSISSLALSQHQILLSNDIAHDERISPALRDRLTIDGIRSLIILPLLYNDEPQGVIGLHFHQTSHGFLESELELLHAVCQTVSLALANARSVLELEHQASHDSLTGLPNRVLLHREATDALRRVAGTAGHLALLLLDLDRFKEVNDTLGHRAGDSLLKLVAQRLAESLHGYDAMLSRLGGDEFAILLRHVESDTAASSLSAMLVESLRRPIEVEGIFIELGGSIGIAIYPQHGGTSHALLRCADVAMYSAKKQTPSISLYDSSCDEHNPRRLAMITELGSAIRGDQLIVHFQPRFALQKGEWCSSEALVRWQHPRLGFIPPNEFVQFAETSELIRPLTLWVARRAISQLSDWHRQGMKISVSVNLSTRNLLDITLPDALADLLREFSIPPVFLELEITETSLMNDPDRAMQVVNRMAELGMRLSVDDFGTGYSSLAYLKKLPLHSLKIDRSFVHEMLHDEQDTIIVRSTIGLAHSLGLEVVAEGVEDAATLARLREFGCDEAQGYVLSKPLPADKAVLVMQAPPPVAFK